MRDPCIAPELSLHQVIAEDQESTSPEPRLERRILAHNPALMLVEHRMEHGWEGARHSHPHDQLVYVVSGHLCFQCEGVAFEVRSGDSFVVKGGLSHKASALEPSIVLDVFAPSRQDYLPARGNNP